jgi:GNAT superfamily N-acetyltransferase
MRTGLRQPAIDGVRNESTGAPETARFSFAADDAMVTSLRRARPDDAGALARLRASSLIELGHLRPAERTAFEPRARDDFARMFADGRVVAWLAVAHDAIVGSACANYFERLPYPEGSLHAELSGVFVEPAYRRQGCASRLVAAVVDDVRRSSVRKTFLRPSSAGRNLYARLGFVDDATGVMSLAAGSRP